MRVELINTREHLLGFLDTEISDALSYHLRDIGVLIRNHEEYEQIECRENDVLVHLKSGKLVRGNAFLWCNGRSGNTHRLDLKAVGLSANDRGLLEVNESYQTIVSHVYAVGDVIGWPSLASAAYYQGRSIGKMEQELTKEKSPMT